MNCSHRRPSRPHRATFLARTVLATCVAALLVGWAAAQVVVTDALGHEVRLERPPERVIAMLPSLGESACAIAACDLLVGRDRHGDHPPELLDLPELGDAFAPDLERLLALEPDLVLVDVYSGLAEALERHGVPTYAGAPERIGDVTAVLADLGALFGREEEAAAEIARIDAAVEAMREASETRFAEPPLVYLEIDPTPFSAGPDSYLGELLALVGARNVVPAEAGPFPALDPETVIASDPDVIVLLDAPYGVTAATVAERPGWGGLSAVRSGAVVEVLEAQGDLLSRAGPRLPEAAALMLELIETALGERDRP